MKTKLRKIMYTAAAALFIGGLAINVYMTLDDPFENVSSLVLAQKTDTNGSGNGNEGCGGFDYCKEHYDYTVHYRVVEIKGEISGGVNVSLGDILSSKVDFGAGVEVKYDSVDMWKRLCGGTDEVQTEECLLQEDYQECPSFGCPGRPSGEGTT